MTWSSNALQIWEARLTRPNESPEQALERVAKTIFPDLPDLRARLYTLMTDKKFLPNTPAIRNLGDPDAPEGVHACYVLPVEDSMEGIFETLKQAALVHKSGGGTGFCFSDLRPRDALVKSTQKIASGPCSFIDVYDAATASVKQGGQRRGANMGTMSIYHPDVAEFIQAKQDLARWQNFNVSVMVDGDFFFAVDHDTYICQQFPVRPGLSEDSQCEESGTHVRARELFDLICRCAHATGEPGILFQDLANKKNPHPELYTLSATNPCLLGTTRMLSREGLIKIEDLARAGEGFELWTHNGWSRALVWKTGEKAVIQIVLSNGQRITATPDHKFLTADHQYVQAKDLLGEKISPFQGPGSWTGMPSLIHPEDLVRLGFIQGDGGFRNDCDSLTVNIGTNDQDVADLFDGYDWHGERVRYISQSDSLAHLVSRVRMDRSPLPVRGLPEMVWTLGSEDLCHFLRGLYSANGSVLVKYRRTTFKSTNRKLVEDLQLLLLALGFRPYITTNKPTMIEWPNGTYESRQSYDLNIVGSEADLFEEKIGFIQQYKQEALHQITRGQKGRRINPTVIAIEPLGIFPVYDFNVQDQTHAAWANGLVTSNCGEVWLGPYESCVLGSINLSRYVASGCIDWASLNQDIFLYVYALDRMIDVATYPTPAIERATKQTRRIGLGVTGWADMLYGLRIPYDSEEALDLARYLGTALKLQARQASMGIALSDGPYPANKAHPALRNAARTAIAPEGTRSILMDCSSGIEPIFAPAVERHHDPNLFSPMTEIKDVDPALPWARFAYQISPAWHVRMQAAWQQSFSDNAISKTINAPKDASLADVGQSLQLAYDLGCLGWTYYRDGSREGQVLTALSDCGGIACAIEGDAA